MTIKPGDPYRPSNGTEGEIFIAGWCNRCQRDAAHRRSDGSRPGCDILARSFAHEIGEEGYPSEWVYGPKGEGICKAWQPERARRARRPKVQKHDRQQLSLISAADNLAQPRMGEAAQTYAAVQHLRARGYLVYRAGKMHSVRSPQRPDTAQLLSTEELIRLAGHNAMAERAAAVQ